MFRRIRIRDGSADFCPYNTPLLRVNNTPEPLPFQWVATVEPFITASYADPHNIPSLKGFTSRPADCGHPPALNEEHAYRSSSFGHRAKTTGSAPPTSAPIRTLQAQSCRAQSRFRSWRAPHAESLHRSCRQLRSRWNGCAPHRPA